MDQENVKVDDHEARMAKADLYKTAQYAAKLFKMINDGDELEGWVQAKITKAADYMSSVYHWMEYDQIAKEAIIKGPRKFDESVQDTIKAKLSEDWKAHRANKG